MRPDLNKETKIEDFKSYYWLKKELQLFCRQLGASTSGSKEELLKRVGIYLETGKVVKPIRQASKKSKKSNNNLNVETVIGEDHRCGQDVRAFFKSMIPQFHFSTFIQQYFKNNSEKTYQDVINAWYEEENRKKDQLIKGRLVPNLNITNSFVTSLRILIIKGRNERMR